MSEKDPAPTVDTVISERDNFNRQLYQNLTWLGNSEIVLNPSEAVNNETLRFIIPPCPPGYFYDLSSIRGVFTLNLQGKDGAVPGNTDIVAPINYFAQTMIKAVEMTMNGTTVCPPTPYYAEKAFLDALINHSRDDRKTILMNQGLIMDDPEHMDDTPAYRRDNKLTPFGRRADYFGSLNAQNVMVFSAVNKMFQVPLLTDVNKVDLPLIHGVDMKVNIYFHSPAFYLWTGPDDTGANREFKLEMESAQLRIKQLKSSAGYAESIEKILIEKPLTYRFKRTEIKLLTFPQNQIDLSAPFVQNLSTLPEMLFVLLRDQSSGRPDYTKNPLNFKSQFVTQAGGTHFTKIFVTVNSEPVNRLDGFDFTSFASLHYQNLMELTGNATFGCGLDRSAFSQGCYIIAFDLTKSGRMAEAGTVRQTVKEGQALLHVGFKEAVQNPVDILCINYYNSSFSVNKNKRVMLNYLD